MTYAMDHGGDGLTRLVTDAVTGAYPRSLLQPRLDEELARAARTGSTFGVFLFDVDFFKTVNDAYGHLRGDEVLRQIAERVSATARAGDVLFRYGGDEFVLLLPEVDRTAAVSLALRLTDAMRTNEFAGDPPLHLSISLGVAVYPEDARDATALISCADRRNYQAKRRGRGGAVADDADTGARSASSRLWERDAAVGGVQDFLTRLPTESRGALRVAGEQGAGHTRFLAEVATVARLRGYTVLQVPAGGRLPEPVVEPGADLLLIADRGAGAQAAELIRRLSAQEQLTGALGVVHTNRVDVGLPTLGTVELAPWSPATLKIWLRTTLLGEPTRTLVNWLAGQSGGLPARAVAELDRLRHRGGLVVTPTGGWTVSPSMLGRPRRRARLPVPMTALVGRATERARVVQLLGGGRLVTLAGPGGIGKTRLALAAAGELADRYDDGAVFVPLADATGTDLVVAAIAHALDVSEVPGVPLLDGVVEYLAEAEMLLVLDNFEQVVAAAEVVSELLSAAPGVSVLVTSRERLALYGEQVYAVPPLSMPDLDALPRGPEAIGRALAEYPALALFEQRAQAAAADFTITADTLSAVAALCARLDGLPLAIELAAARADRLSPQSLLADLVHHLDGLGDGPRDLPARQQTLRGAIDWSFVLLEPADQYLFTTLAVFAGGCTAEAALDVLDAAAWGAPADEAQRVKELAARLGTLADKSLMVAEPDPGGGSRYRMLETIRAYALARLSADPGAGDVYSRHAAYYAAFAARSGDALTGPDQAVWANRVDVEYPNLRSAFATGDPDLAARICLGLWRFWRNGSHIGEGREWLVHVLACPDVLTDATAAQLLYAAAVLAATQDDHVRAYVLAEDGLRRAEAAGERPTIAQAYNALGLAALGAGRYALAVEHLRACLAIWRELGQTAGTAIALGNLTKASLRLGDIAAADGYAQQSLEIERAAGNTRGILLGLECLGEILLAKGDVPGARAALDESLALSRTLGDLFGEAMALHQLGLAARTDGDEAEALRLCTGALARRHEIGDREDLAISLDAVAGLVAAREPELAAQLLGAADGMRDRHRLPAPPAGDERDATADGVRAQLGERGYTTAWTTGRSAPLGLIVDQALDLVL